MSDYLVEVTPGRELLYPTPLALLAAMRSGEITAESRIFHRATSRWISITKHPEYRRFQAERTTLPPWVDRPPLPELVVSPPAELVVPPPVRKQRGFFRSLAKVGAELATSGWASLRVRFDSGSAKAAKSPNRAAKSPNRPASSPNRPVSTPNRPARSLKPVPGAKPGQPDPQTEAQDPDPTPKGWTLYP